eukprot:753522-Hanusia_phi.AAC.4
MPIVRVAVEPSNPLQHDLLVHGLQLLNRADPSVEVRIQVAISIASYTLLLKPPPPPPPPPPLCSQPPLFHVSERAAGNGRACDSSVWRNASRAMSQEVLPRDVLRGRRGGNASSVHRAVTALTGPSCPSSHSCHLLHCQPTLRLLRAGSSAPSQHSAIPRAERRRAKGSTRRPAGRQGSDQGDERAPGHAQRFGEAGGEKGDDESADVFLQAGDGWEEEWKCLWALGPKHVGPNVLLCHVEGFHPTADWIPAEFFDAQETPAGEEERQRLLSEMESSAVTGTDLQSIFACVGSFLNPLPALLHGMPGFQICSLAGPLCEEPMEVAADVMTASDVLC